MTLNEWVKKNQEVTMIKKLKVAMSKSGHSKPLAAVMIGISLPTLYSVLSGKVCSQLTENAIQRYIKKWSK